MTRDTVAHAIARLHAQGKQVSIRALRREVGGGSLRDLVRWRAILMAPPDALPATETVAPGVRCMNNQTAGATPAPVLEIELPIALRFRCGRGVWHERVLGEFVCITCGVRPPT
jgi:hypothetical protein